MCSLRAETGEGGNAAEGNVWTLSGGILSKGDWRFPAEWQAAKKILNVTGYTDGSGVLDWDGFVLRMEGQMISDLAVNLVWNVFAAAPITEFRCDKAIFDSWAFRGNKSLVSVRAGGPRMTILQVECFANCTSLTNVVFDFPNVKAVGYGVFSGCTSLKADVMDILNPGITTIDAAFYGTSNVAGLTGTLTLTNVTSIAKRAFNGTGLTGVYLAGPCTNIQDGVFFNCTSLREATFDLAPDARVETDNTFGGIWGSAPLERIRFLRKPFDAVSMTNLFTASSKNIRSLTAANALVIGVSRSQWPKEEREACAWWRPATAETLTETELAAMPQGCMGIAEIRFPDGMYAIGGKTRRAWIVHEASPHDKGGFYLRIR